MCECSIGQCCDGCHFLPAGTYYYSDIYDTECTGAVAPDYASCPGYQNRILLYRRDVYCAGDATVYYDNYTVTDSKCGTSQYCVASTDPYNLPFACRPCPS
jgi:methyl coenzyme M reductase beta subunit